MPVTCSGLGAFPGATRRAAGTATAAAAAEAPAVAGDTEDRLAAADLALRLQAAAEAASGHTKSHIYGIPRDEWLQLQVWGL